MKRYGYHRTSTREQHLDRGIKEITAYCEQNNLELEKIFTDQQTGKNFNRPRYQVLKEDVLRAGDELIITEVDRLCRNKQETLKKLQHYRDNDIRVKILELPTTLMDLSKLDNAMARMLMETIAYVFDEDTNTVFNETVEVIKNFSLVLKAVIEDSFNPKFREKNNDQFDVLITTDVLAEGINLHRANALINYDLQVMGCRRKGTYIICF